MAHYGGPDGYSPWDTGTPSAFGNDHSPQSLSHKLSNVSVVSAMSDSVGARGLGLSHKMSTISAVSTMSTDNRRDSNVSMPSPPLVPLYSNEQSDISHVKLRDVGGSGIQRPSSASSLHQVASSLPDALRIGDSASPSPSPPVSRPYLPFGRSSGPSYSPVSSLSSGESSRRPSVTSRTSSTKYSAKRKSSLRHGSIPENEEIDMGLLQNAMPMPFTPQTRYSAVAKEEPDDIGRANFDLSSFMGPIGTKTDAEWKEINDKEKKGQLTGGLGAGWTPDEIVTRGQFMANTPPTPTTPVGRKFSIRGTRPARAPTLRDLAQSEANKRGKIIEVIVEDQAEAEEDVNDEPIVPMDLSSFENTGTTRTATFDLMKGTGLKKFRKETLPVKEVFYPQSNWKPFSMRWPYLSVLILLSVGLAAVQEYLFQKSVKNPLYEFEDAAKLSTWDYFCFKYMPTLAAVSFGILWQITDFEVKRLEAYYQLSKEGGALAAESLNVDYITFFNFLRPVRALRYKHYAVAVSSVATLIAVSAIPTLQSASIILSPDRKFRSEHKMSTKTITIHPVWSRLISVLLLVIAMFGCILVWQLEKRRSGLVADVKGIAGIAAMANKSHILTDFKDLDRATPEEIHKRLKTHRYTLRNSSLAPDSDNTLSQEEQDRYADKKYDANPHPLMLRLFAGIPFIIGMVLFMVFMPLVLFLGPINSVTENTPWLLTVIAVAIKLAWGTLETDVRMIEPFYILSKRHASPKVLTLDYTAMAFGYMPIRALLNGHFLVFLVGLGSVLAEVLTICASSFGNVNGTDFAKMINSSEDKRSLLYLFRRKDDDRRNGGEETFLSFWVSFSLAVLILTFLCLVATFVYLKRRHPFLPRQPNTISSVLAFIHQSKMLYDFVDTEKMNNDEMVKKLGKIGKTYGLGWFQGRDGSMHCGVDEEELSGDYVHGHDGKKTNQPWNEDWQNF